MFIESSRHILSGRDVLMFASFSRFNHSLRRLALERIAVLAAQVPHAHRTNNEASKISDFDRLTEQCTIVEESTNGVNGKVTSNGSINGHLTGSSTIQENILVRPCCLYKLTQTYNAFSLHEISKLS